MGVPSIRTSRYLEPKAINTVQLSRRARWRWNGEKRRPLTHCQVSFSLKLVQRASSCLITCQPISLEWLWTAGIRVSLRYCTASIQGSLGQRRRSICRRQAWPLIICITCNKGSERLAQRPTSTCRFIPSDGPESGSLFADYSSVTEIQVPMTPGNGSVALFRYWSHYDQRTESLGSKERVPRCPAAGAKPCQAFSQSAMQGQ